MSDSPPELVPGQPRRVLWVLVAFALVVVALLTFVIVGRVAAARERAEQDAAEGTAWENRVEMDRVLVDSARLIGVEGEVQSEREAPLACVRRDGRQGVSYFLHEVRGEPLEDPRSALEAVARSWADAGYAVADVARASELWRVSAETQDGAPILLLTGPGGTVLSGETGCFLRDGAPGTP